MNTISLQTPRKSPNEFVPVEGGGDTTSAEALLVIAYIAMWLLFFAFLLLTHRRQRSLNRKVTELEQALKKAESGGAGGSS